jgi:hypothetical protein
LTGIGDGLGFHKKKGWEVYDKPWEKTSVEIYGGRGFPKIWRSNRGSCTSSRLKTCRRGWRTQPCEPTTNTLHLEKAPELIPQVFLVEMCAVFL